jgi:hypothetical protein
MHGHQINEFLEHEAGAAQNGSAHSLPEVGARSRSAGKATAATTHMQLPKPVHICTTTLLLHANFAWQRRNLSRCWRQIT